MSIQVMTQVWAHSRQKGSKLLLLLAIADFANDDGVAWPSVGTLATKIRMSERQTGRLLDQLHESGELLMVEEGGGRGNTNIVRVAVNPDKLSEKGDKMSGNEPLKGDISAPERVTSCHVNPDKLSERVTFSTVKGDIAMSPDPSVDPPIEPSKEPSGENRAQARPPAPELQRTQFLRSPRPASGQVRVASPHFAAADFVDGFVPAGQGANAVQVYYERFCINQRAALLTPIQENDLVRNCPDLARLREVVTAYSQTNYKPGNVRLILDWYRDGPPVHRSKDEGRPRQSAGSDAVDRVFARLQQEGVLTP